MCANDGEAWKALQGQGGKGSDGQRDVRDVDSSREFTSIRMEYIRTYLRLLDCPCGTLPGTGGKEETASLHSL